jgi:hypothetical protein
MLKKMKQPHMSFAGQYWPKQAISLHPIKPGTKELR